MTGAGSLLLRLLWLAIPAAIAIARNALRVLLLLAPLLMLAVAWRALSAIMTSEAGSIRLESVELSPSHAPYDLSPVQLMQGDALRTWRPGDARREGSRTRLRVAAETGADGQTRWQVSEPTGSDQLILRYRDANREKIVVDSVRIPVGRGITVEIDGRSGIVSFEIARTEGGIRIIGKEGARGLDAVLDWKAQKLERFDVASGAGLQPVAGECLERGWINWAVDGVRGIAGRRRDSWPVVSIGGMLHCRSLSEPPRVAVPELWSGTLALVETAGELDLVSGASNEPAAKAAVFGAIVIDNNGKRTRLAAQPWSQYNAFGQLERLAFGQTTYLVTTSDAGSGGAQVLTLTPAARRTWSARDEMLDAWLTAQRDTASVSFSGCAGHKNVGAQASGIVLHVACGIPASASPRPPAILLLLALGATAGGICAIVAGFVRRRSTARDMSMVRRRTHGFAKALVIGSTTALAVAIAANLLVESASGLLAATGLRFGLRFAVAATLTLWAAASMGVVAALANRLEGLLLWAAVTFLALTGMVALADLGFAMGNERYTEFFTRSLPALALFAVGTLFGVSLERNHLVARLEAVAYNPRALVGRAVRWPSANTWLRHAPNLVLWLSLILWVLFGSAEGINRIVQPSEYVKFGAVYALSLMMVICFTFLFTVPARNSYSFLALGLVNAILGAVLVGVPTIQHDYSPVLIMGLSCIAMCILGGAAGLIALLVRQRSPASAQLPVGRLGLKIAPDEAKLHRRWSARPATEFLVHTLTLLRMSLAWLLGRGIFVTLVLLAVSIGAYASWKAFDMLTPDESDVASSTLPGADVGRRSLIRRHDEARGCAHGGTLCSTKFFGRVVSHLDLALEPDSNGPVDIAYPDEGAQVRRSRLAIATAPCLPPAIEGRILPGLPGLQAQSAYVEAELRKAATWSIAQLATYACGGTAATPPRPLGSPIRSELASIPVIQNDFIGAYLIGRFGHVLALLVALAQALVVLIAIVVGMASVRLRRGLVAELARHQLQSLLCIGAGMLLGLQWAIAWANVFGLLPVMGQPMTFLAYASSNIVLLGLPAVLVVLTTIRLDGANSGTPQIGRPRSVSRL